MKFHLAFILLFSTPAFSGAQTQYIVQKGDTVLKIADKNLGTTERKDPSRYDYAKQIQKLNPEIKDLNLLLPGQTLIIPTKNKPAAVERQKIQVTPQAIAAEPAPVPVVAPPPPLTEPPAHVVTHHEVENHRNFLFVQPRIQIVNLDVENLATETEAKLKSKTSFGLDLQYGKIINEKFHLLFQAGITQTNYKDIEGDATAIDHKSETSKAFGVGLAYEVTPALHLDFMMLYADHTFLLPGVVAAEYKLESVTIPGAELNVSWEFYSGSTNILGVSVIAEYIANYTKDEIDYKSALEPFGALYWKSNLGHDETNYKATLTYKHGHQKTNVSEQKEELASLGFGLYF